jgi:predicted nucleic acid-binding protein
MILIDTSVWVEFFKQNPRYVREVQSLLKARLVLTIEPIFSELVYGVRREKDRKVIRAYWNILPKIEFGPNSMIEAAEFANQNKYYQLGIGLVDAIIIKSVVEGKYSVWTLDRKISSNIDPVYVYQ